MQFPVPQGERGCRGHGMGSSAFCRHLPVSIMALICRKRPGYFLKGHINERYKLAGIRILMVFQVFRGRGWSDRFNRINTEIRGLKKGAWLHMDTKNTFTAADIGRMRDVDPAAVDRSALKDIRDVHVDTELPKKERILDFIRQIGNPYCYRCGDYVVKVGFADTDVTLEDRMLSYIRSKC